MVPFLCCVLGRVVLICSSLLMSEKKKGRCSHWKGHVIFNGVAYSHIQMPAEVITFRL